MHDKETPKANPENLLKLYKKPMRPKLLFPSFSALLYGNAMIFKNY